MEETKLKPTVWELYKIMEIAYEVEPDMNLDSVKVVNRLIVENGTVSNPHHVYTLLPAVKAAIDGHCLDMVVNEGGVHQIPQFIQSSPLFPTLTHYAISEGQDLLLFMSERWTQIVAGDTYKLPPASSHVMSFNAPPVPFEKSSQFKTFQTAISDIEKYEGEAYFGPSDEADESGDDIYNAVANLKSLVPQMYSQLETSCRLYNGTVEKATQLQEELETQKALVAQLSDISEMEPKLLEINATFKSGYESIHTYFADSKASISLNMMNRAFNQLYDLMTGAF